MDGYLVKRRTVGAVVALCMVGAGAGLLWAGPLNPPTGPISSGGKTTQEIYDAVTGISNSIGGSGRGPAVPGGSVAVGSLSIPASGPFAAINVPLIGLRLSMTGASYQTNGQILGTTTLTGCTLVREIGAGEASQLRMMSGGFSISAATATINSAGGPTTYQFGPAVISGMRSYSVQRADGTYGSIEEIDLSMQSVRVTDSAGTWMYNFITHTGGG
jgi:hypothetical protein